MTFEKAGLRISEVSLKAAQSKSKAFNAIDTRDLADVYLSSAFNEPSSAEIANLVKRYIVEGSIQPKPVTRPPIRAAAELPSIVPATVLCDAGEEETYSDLCGRIASFSLDQSASALWQMRREVLNRMLDAISADLQDGKTTGDGVGKVAGRTWNIAPVVHNPTFTSTRHEHSLSLVPERRRYEHIISRSTLLILVSK